MEGSWLALNASQAGLHCGEGKEPPPPPQRSPGTISTRLAYNWAGGAVRSSKEVDGSKLGRADEKRECYSSPFRRNALPFER